MLRHQLAAGCSPVIVFFKFCVAASLVCGFILGIRCELHAQTPGPQVSPPSITSSPPHQREELHWHESLESGWDEAKMTGRPMVIFITSEQCVYCDAMKRDTLSNESVRKRLFGRFVSIRLRPGANHSVLSRIQIPAYPTTLVAYPQGKVATHRIGYQPVDQFLEMLNEVATAEDPAVIR